MLRHISLIVNPMPPRITEKSYRPRVSDRTMVATSATVSLVGLQKSNRVGDPPFPLRRSSQNGPRRKGGAAPRRNGAPLTAPGRSAEIPPNKRERRAGKPVTTLRNILALRTATRHAVLRHKQPPTARRAGCRKFSRLQLEGELFLLTSFFIEPNVGVSFGHLSTGMLRPKRGAPIMG